MLAMLCKELGPPEKLVLEETASPKIRKKHVRITVHACGLNFPDTLIIQGLYQAKPPLPFAPGSEVSGIVSEVGEGVDTIKVGDRVLAMTLCGGLAEEVVVPAAAVVAIPESMDFDTAAGFILTYGTAYYALKQRAQLAKDETLLVLGAAGGVGLAAVELGKAMGAKVIAAASTSEKLAICQQHGADHLINYSEQDLRETVKKLTAHRGVDIVYDPVGGDLFDQASRLMDWNGRYLVIGFASGRIPELPANLPLVKGYSLMGVFWGNFVAREPEASIQNTLELLQWYEKGTINPLISEVFPLIETKEAMYRLINREAKGKIVVRIEG